MRLCVRVVRGLALSFLVLGGIAVGAGLATVASTGVAIAQSAGSIVVEGNRRVEAETVRSYFRPGPGGRLGPNEVDEGLKALYATGLFSDVRINNSGNRLVVTVVENPVLNRVAFEGNKKAKDEQLKVEVQSKPRGTLSKPTVQADVQRIIEIYNRSGRFDVSVVPKIIELPNNRVDLVFEIKEGDKTGVKDIKFVGNKAFSYGRLKDVIKTSESNWLSFLQTTDIYDPDRVEADRDLLRRFYLKHGYADVRIVSAIGEYDPAKKGFVISFTIDEGNQYRVGTVDVVSNVRTIDPATLRDKVKLSAGNVYNADMVEKSVEAMTVEAAKRGYAFASVRPRGDRNAETRTINLAFVVDEGAARLYRAHQHSRQCPHARLCHPPRVRYQRRRRLQPCADRPRRAPVEEPGFLQERQDHERARLGAGSCRRQRRSRRKVDRRVLHRRRLFDRRRLHRRSQRRRPQPHGPRPVCQSLGDLRSAHPRRRTVFRRAVSARLSDGRRHRSVRQAEPGVVNGVL